jgi:hypothetical protein
MHSHADLEQRLEAICQSDAWRAWQERLTACFYEKDRKDACIRQVRETVAAQAADLAVEDVEALQKAVVGRLVGLASQAARRPQDPAEPPASRRSPEELEDLVIDQFPYPIAACYRRFTEAASPTGAFGCLLDTFESLLHYLATVVLSVYWRDGAFDTEHNRRLLEKLYKGKWSPGDLMDLLRETTRRYLGRAQALPYPQLCGYLFTPGGNPTPSLAVLEGFVELRNRVWGHGVGRDDRFYGGIVPPHRQRLEEELSRCDWLTTRALWLPKAVAEEGGVTAADLLNGDRRRRNRPVTLPVDPQDLDLHGGDVVPEHTLLLVDEATGHYLPLFPLSLFHFQSAGQGPFFLSDLDWAARAERLKKARYVAYDPLLADHEARAGQPAAGSLEVKVQQLAAALQAQGVALHTMTATVREVEEYDLPEVWTEQQSHLKTFAGRTEWLQHLHAWVDRTADGGYFLLLGPPGQGKSALLAQFAHAEGAGRTDAGRGCLLHMVKSHKQPRRFLQFLLWQTARLLGAPLDAGAYRGDIDDLRNALVGALEKVRQQRGRALLVIDALDELDPSGERITFLPATLPTGVRVVLACRPEIPLVTALRRRLRSLAEAHLPPLTAEDLPLVLERFLEPTRVRMLRRAVDFDALFRRTGGNPLFLKRAMERLLDEVIRAEQQGLPVPAMDVTVFPNTVEAVFEDIYTQVAEKVDGRFTSDAGRHKARLLQLLAVAREALSIDDLRGVLRADGVRLSLEEARDLVLQMSEYLLSYDGERFVPFHQGFTDYLQQKVLGEDGIAEAHRVFCQWLNTPCQRRSHYHARYLPEHVFESGTRFARFGMEHQVQEAFEHLKLWLEDIRKGLTEVDDDYDQLHSYLLSIFQAILILTRFVAMVLVEDLLRQRGELPSEVRKALYWTKRTTPLEWAQWLAIACGHLLQREGQMHCMIEGLPQYATGELLPALRKAIPIRNLIVNGPYLNELAHQQLLVQLEPVFERLTEAIDTVLNWPPLRQT